MAINIPADVLRRSGETVSIPRRFEYNNNPHSGRNRERNTQSTSASPRASSVPKSRFRYKDEISRHLAIENKNHAKWLTQKADAVCEETLIGLLAAKSAKAAFLTFKASVVQVQQDLWNKVLSIDGHIDETVQTHWVKSAVVDLSQYWTSVLRNAGRSALVSEQQQEFTKLIEEAHQLLQNQANAAGRAFMKSQQITTLDELVANGATASVTFPETDTTNIQSEPIMTSTQDNNGSNEHTPFPNIDEAMLDESIAKHKADGMIKRAIAAVKESVTKIKDTVKSYKFDLTFAIPIWKLAVALVIVSLVLIATLFFRRNVTVKNISAGDIGSIISRGWSVMKNTMVMAAVSIKNSWNMILNWFSSPTIPSIDQPMSAGIV
jgi:predicted HAD superfamily Cof-like phosphohydrolase